MGRLIDWAFMQEPEGVQAKLLLVHICHNIENDYGTTMEWLCDHSEASPEQVAIIMGDLRSQGLISFDGEFTSSTIFTVNVKFNVTVGE